MTKRTLRPTIAASLIATHLMASAQAVRADAPGTTGGEVTTPLADPQQAWGLLGELLSMLFGLAIIGAAIVAFVYLIIGALQWGTAGSGEGAANGRKTMMYAAIGLVMVSLVYVFMIFYNTLSDPA